MHGNDWEGHAKGEMGSPSRSELEEKRDLNGGST